LTLRILWLSDKIVGGYSAYSKVTYETCTRLSRMGYQVAHVPMGRANRMGKQAYQGVLIYPSGDDPFSESAALEAYTDWRADLLIALKEPWVFQFLHRYGINLVPYSPIDHSPVSPSITSRLHTAFRILVPSRFAQRELKQAGIDPEKVRYCPHGVDVNIYRDLEERKADCKRLFFFEPDEFVVGIVAMNRARKLIPRQLRGYKRFIEINPDVKSRLMLWTNVYPSAQPQESPMGVADVGVNLLPEILELGLGEAVRWPDSKLVQEGLPEWLGEDYRGGWDMVKLYNCFSVLLHCTGGEGFALPLIEAQATGCPVITTDYAAAPEQVGAGLTVKASDYIVINTPGTRYALADIDKMAEALTKIYNTDREKLAKKARKFAERYDWSQVMEKYFKPFLEEAELELKPLITQEEIKAWD